MFFISPAFSNFSPEVVVAVITDVVVVVVVAVVALVVVVTVVRVVAVVAVASAVTEKKPETAAGRSPEKISVSSDIFVFLAAPKVN